MPVLNGLKNSMKVLIPWTLVVFLSIGCTYSVCTLRQVNNRLGYELIQHDEIEAMRANLKKWQIRAYRYNKLWAECQGRPFNWREVTHGE